MALSINTSRTSPNRGHGRGGRKVRHITIHYWGRWVGQSHQGIVDWLCKKRSNPTSAHYVVSPGRIDRIVPEGDTSWANGNRVANQESITIELCPDPARLDATIATAGELVADIRSRHGNIPLVPHKRWTSTDCPGPFTNRLDDIDRAARGKVTAVSKGTSAAAPKASPGAITVDGRYGTSTHSLVQRRMGRPVDGRLGRGDITALCAFFDLPDDGVISNQPRRAAEIGNAIVPEIWEHDPGHVGPRSRLVRCIEAYVGAEVDRGAWGPALTERIQTFSNQAPGLWTPADKPVALARTAHLR